MAQFDSATVAAALNAKGVGKRGCPACGYSSGYETLPGFAALLLEKDTTAGTNLIGTSGMVTVAIGCKHCGFVLPKRTTTV